MAVAVDWVQTVLETDGADQGGGRSPDEGQGRSETCASSSTWAWIPVVGAVATGIPLYVFDLVIVCRDGCHAGTIRCRENTVECAQNIDGLE